MIYLLILPLLFLVRQIMLRPRVIISHRETFTIGFLWYAGMPMWLSVSAIEIDTPALRYWQSIATLMGPAQLQQEVIWGFCVWLAFVAGCAAAYRRAPAITPARLDDAAAESWRVVLTGVGIASMLFGLAWAVANRALLFRGYAVEYDDIARGPLQGALVYTSVSAIIAFLRRDAVGPLPVAVNAAALLVLTILSLSVGTRSMPVLVAIMLVALASRLRGGLRRTTLAGLGAAAIVTLSALAAWRQGTSDVGFAVLSPALEPLYTYISAATYLTFNDISTFSFPAPLLGSLVNLVPRAIWPEKVDYLDSLLAGIQFFAPLGAMHLFVSLLINFGWLGSLVAMFGAGAAVERLSRSGRPAVVASYTVIAAVMTTDLWRNPFSQSLTKSVLQGAILVPLLLTLAAAILAELRRRPDAAPPVLNNRPGPV